VALHLLTPREVLSAKDGDHADGDGLVLRVRGARCSWLFRFTSPSTGKRRDMGMGSVLRTSLAAAGESLRLVRTKATRAREQLAAGRDPLEEKREIRRKATEVAERAKAERRADEATLARVARRYHETAIEGRMNGKYAEVWIARLENHIPPAIWHKPISRITAPELLEALAPIRMRTPETADRIRRSLAAVFDDAHFHGLCTTNPANAIRRKLSERGRKTERHLTALPYQQVPKFMSEAALHPGSASLALRFAILTAARTAEVVGARWEEIDFRTRIWAVPGERMKGREEHHVYLSDEAIDVLAQARNLGSEWCFPSPLDPQKMLSNMAMLSLIKRMKRNRDTTVHGVARASFSTWANETEAGRPDVIEAALAHKEEDRVRRAYNRAAFTRERAELLSMWGRYCGGGPSKDDAIPLLLISK
jgi:integrase